MTSKLRAFSNRKIARIAGGVYLGIIVGGLAGSMLIRGELVDLQNAQYTLTQLVQQEVLYRWGFFSDLVMVICDLVIAFLFYALFRKVHHGIAALATLFRLLQTGVLASNLVHLYQPLLLVQQPDVVPERVIFHLQVFEMGYLISGVFFAVNCLLMGYLVWKSSGFPKVLGILLALAGIGYGFNSLSHFVFPSAIEASSQFMFFTAIVGELGFCLYLLVVGSYGKSIAISE